MKFTCARDGKTSRVSGATVEMIVDDVELAQLARQPAQRHRGEGHESAIRMQCAQAVRLGFPTRRQHMTKAQEACPK
jgi:hypothetical protein